MSYYDDSYFNREPITTTISNTINTKLVWDIVIISLAIIIGIVLYYTVFSKKNENKYTGFMKYVYDFVHFKFFIIDDLFRIIYLISFIIVTVYAFTFVGRWQFLPILVGGNLAVRITYELLMLTIELCHNVRSIANKKK